MPEAEDVYDTEHFSESPVSPFTSALICNQQVMGSNPFASSVESPVLTGDSVYGPSRPAHGTVSPYQLPVELPTAWSAAFGPDEKLALGLSTNDVALISGSDLMILDGLATEGAAHRHCLDR